MPVKRIKRAKNKQQRKLRVAALVGLSSIAGLVAIVLTVVSLQPTTPKSEAAHGPLFTPAAISYGTGSNPTDITAGDFDGDGHQDVAVGNTSASTVSVFLGNNTGIFTDPVDYAVDCPLGLTVGLFNGDSVQDIISADCAGSYTRLWGVGDGTFSVQTPIAAGSCPQDIVNADFNGVGGLDFAIIDACDSVAYILLGDGAGSFSAAVPASAPIGNCSLRGETGLIDAGSTADLAVTNNCDDTVSILLGDGDGSFTPATPATQATASDPRGLALGDFNGDSLLDMVVALNSGNQVDLFKGNGDGSFDNVGFLTMGIRPVDVALADMTGDGRLDLVAAANDASLPKVVLRAKTDTGFSAETQYSTMERPENLAISDINADGAADLLHASAGNADGFALFFGNGDGTLAVAPQYPVGTFPQDVTLATLDADSNLDAIVANRVSGTVGVLLGDGSGGFGAQTTFAAPTPSAVAAADFDGDVDNDIAVVNGDFGSGGVTIMLNDGAGNLSISDSELTGLNPANLVIGLFDGDAFFDLIVTNQSSFNYSFLSGNGDGTFDPAVTTLLSGFFITPHEVVSCMCNGDGFLDFAVRVTAGFRRFYGNGDGTFVEQAGNGVTDVSNPFGIAAGDFDNDGDTDLATTAGTFAFGHSDGRIGVSLNNGVGVFGATVYYSTWFVPFDVKTGDVDGDGILDLVSTNDIGSNATVLLGNGDGTFETSPAYLGNYGMRNGETGDLDGDGRSDLVAVNSSNNSITVGLTSAVAPSVLITESAGSTTVQEGGASDSFTVELTTQPSDDVTITLSFGPDISAAPTTLTFTPANWNVPQTVTVTAVVDADVEGTHSDSVAFTVASLDPDYDALVVTPVVVTVTEGGPGSPIVRIPEDDPTQLAIQISEIQFATPGSADALVLARPDVLADAFTVTPLARLKNASLLLTPTTGVTPAVMIEIQRALGSASSNKTIYLAGGLEALSAQVDADLIAAGYDDIVRFAGEHRRQTAQFIGNQIAADNPTMTKFYLAEDTAFVDSLGLGSIASDMTDGKVEAILLNQRGVPQIDATVATFIHEHPAVTSVEIAGGDAAIPTIVDTLLPQQFAQITEVSRRAGADRYATNRAMHDVHFTSPITIVIANGEATNLAGARSVEASASGSGLFGALLASNFAAAKPGPLLITRTADLPAPIFEYIQAHNGTIEEIFIVGTTNTVSQAVEDSILAAIATPD